MLERVFLGCGFFAVLGKVIEGVHKLCGRVYTVDIHTIGDVEEDIRVVEYYLDAGVCHQLGDVLGGGGGGGDDADHLVGLGDALLELVDVLDDDVTNGTPNLLRVVIEDIMDHEPPLGEDSAARDGAPKVTRPDE